MGRRQPSFRRNVRKPWFTTLATFFGLAAILLLILGGLAAVFFLGFDTQYAPGYSEAKFKAIKLGYAEQVVLSSLGQPFSTEDTQPYVAWVYSADNQRRFSRTGEGSGTYTTVRFDADNRVVSINGAVQTSVNTFSFGEGLNYLKLTQAQINKLKGSSQDDFK